MFRNCSRVLGGALVLSLTLSAQTFTTLYNFGSYEYDGAAPKARVILGPLGVLCGTTYAGGESSAGTVYELLPPASPGGAWTELVLHSFNFTDGESPAAAVQMGPSGALYGVANDVAFELRPPMGGNTHWPYTVIYQFTEGGSNPSGALVFGMGQSLYGAAEAQNGGTVYSLTPASTAGGDWTQTILYSFPGGSGGQAPLGTLAVSGNGTLFGVAALGGRTNSLCPYGCGMVFSLTPPTVSGGLWAEKVLYAFEAQTGDGKYPVAGVVIGPNGVLYGTTYNGGGAGCSCGTVFSLIPPGVPGRPMTETILHSFTGPDGTNPSSSLVLGSNGVLYGTTEGGGASGDGIVFELSPPASPGGSWSETILHTFAGTDAAKPNGLALGADGTLYGTAESGGAFNHGTVFSVTP